MNYSNFEIRNAKPEEFIAIGKLIVKGYAQ